MAARIEVPSWGRLGLAAESGFRSHPPAAPSPPANGTERTGANMRSFSWWQMVRVLRGLEPGDHDLFGITDNPRPEFAPRAVLQRLADGDAVVRGIPFDGQMPQPIPKDAWSHVYFEIRKGWPFAHNDEDFGIVAVLHASEGCSRDWQQEG